MKRILILGGGFGGVYAALTLERLLKAELDRGEVELGLVSRDNYIVFQPMLPEVISGSIGIVDTITPIRRLCPRTNLYNYLMKLPGLDRKIRVAVDWTLNLLPPPDTVQLRTERSVGIRREHFEPGEVMGGHGDWLYIVVDGQVEVLKRVPGQGTPRCAASGPGTASERSRSWATTSARPRPGASPRWTCSRWTATPSRGSSRRCRRSGCSSSGSWRTAWLRWPPIPWRARN